MAGLPKSIIKKYGVTKKAWSVFRSHSRSRKAVRTQVKTTMAKRRFSRVRSSFRRGARRIGRSDKTQALIQSAIAGAIVGAAMKYTPAQYNTRITRLGAGAAATVYGSGYIKKAGETLIALEAASFTNSALSGNVSLGGQTGDTLYN